MAEPRHNEEFPRGFDAFYREFNFHRSLFTILTAITAICGLVAVNATYDLSFILVYIAAWVALFLGVFVSNALRSHTTGYHYLVGEVVQATLMVLMAILPMLVILLCFLTTANVWTLVGLATGAFALRSAWRFVDDLLIHPDNLPEWRERWNDEDDDFDTFRNEDGFDDRI